MDGNGRWAKKRFLPRIAGHRAGVKTVDRIVTICRKLDIEALTLYAFSDENWGRPSREISGLMRILKEFLVKETPRMIRENIRFNTIGMIEDLPEFIQETIRESKEKTRDMTGMVLTLALSYGARREIVEAARKLAEKAAKGTLDPKQINLECFESELFTANLPELDLLIRTSGEYRVSNFLLYQIAYAELYFTETLWPEYGEKDLHEAIIEFGKRERRFGLTGEQLKKKEKGSFFSFKRHIPWNSSKSEKK
jgi:undecaprenyl diphosphate synthase